MKSKVFNLYLCPIIMDKLMIYATGNLTKEGSTNVSYYIIERDKYFPQWLKNLLQEFELSKDVELVESEEEGTVFRKDLDEMIDIHERYESKYLRVDIFYGNKRVYLTFSGKPEEKFAKMKLLMSCFFVKASRRFLSERHLENLKITS
jgi:hypothetical protein